MPQSLEAGLPPMQLTDGYKIVFEARDSTGTAVAGVKISAPLIMAEVSGDISLVEEGGPFMWLPGPEA